MLAKNLNVICQWQDGAYNCTIELFDAWTQTWETDVSYCARSGDPAEVNIWILEQISTGAFEPIGGCPIPPPKEFKNDTSEVPTVI